MEDRTKFIAYLSPAKLNLGLKVVGKKSDGYHLLNTIFCLIDLFDLINIQIIDTPRISLINHQQAWSYTKDLTFKAAKLLQEITNCKLGANIKVDKVIPSGAGLGGGSSNAATVLIALNHLWQLNLSKAELVNIGRQLGADVPFFIHGKNAYATGIGDEFSNINLPQMYFLLIKPNFHIPTRDIFTTLNFRQPLLENTSPEILLTTMENDLQAIAIKLHPKLGQIIKELSVFGRTVMTGSGSVVFLRFPDENSANKVAQQLGKSYNTYLLKSMETSPTLTMNC